MQNHTEQAVLGGLQLMLERVAIRIQELSIKTIIPTYLSQQIFSMLSSNLNVMVWKEPLRSHFKEQVMTDVPILPKDTLMPKELAKQSVVNDNQSSVTLNISSLGLKNKRSQLSKLCSSSLSSKLAKTERGGNLKVSKLNKSQRQQDNNVEALKPAEVIEDPEIERLRFRTQRRLQDDLEYKRMQLNHEKSFKEKLQQIQSLQLQDPSVSITHDYDGQSIRSMMIDDKINYYAARPGIGAAKKQFKDGNKIYVPPQPSYINSKKGWQEKDNSKELKAMEMPLFPQPQHHLLPVQGFRNYKLNEYKKHFGRGFSRLDQISKTIDFTPTKDPSDAIFSERKHLNDSHQLSTLSKSNLKNSHISRRLALPKLHGRYKVLDRYSEL